MGVKCRRHQFCHNKEKEQQLLQEKEQQLLHFIIITNMPATIARTPPKATVSQKEYLHKVAKRVARAMKAKRAWIKAKCVEKRKMASFSKPGLSYTVTKHSCTCPDFKFRRRPKGQACKHMKKLLEASETSEPTKENVDIPEWTPEDVKWLASFSKQ